MDLKNLSECFANPPAKFRSLPFWSWNDKLSKAELDNQVRDMKEHGMGGFFMHSREGLETVYMSDEWMECVRTAVKAAKEAGMQAWIYDEDRWPSGAAGGLVPAAGGDAYRAKGLVIYVAEELDLRGDVVAAYRAKLHSDSIEHCERLDCGLSYRLDAGEVFIILKRMVSGKCEWFNDDTAADNLNPECVREFIRTTYEVYKNNIGNEFGGAVGGFFTDEPNIADRRCVFPEGKGWIPWTDDFIQYFRFKRGYDVVDFLPYIFFDGEKSSKTRHDYWRTITEKFCESYSKQLGEWCVQNGAAFTGHFLYENDMGTYIRVGGAVMPHYRYQHVPGVDLLSEQTDEVLTMKQCTSVANQYGREFVLSEMYGCTGWDFDFEGQKWLGDWQFVMGVNLRCQHLALYSLKGCRKRDFPPAFSYNTCWWKYNGIVEDHFARVSCALSQGRAVRDILVLHPLSTAWSMLGCESRRPEIWNEDKNLKKVDEFGYKYSDLLRFMLGQHYDFDLGDEIIMEETGRIEYGKMCINKASYHAVVLPQAATLFKSTVKLLQEFMYSGGKVIALKPHAYMIEGEEDENVESLFKHKNMVAVEGLSQLKTALENSIPRRVSIEDKYELQCTQVLYLLKELPDYNVLFLVNNDRKNSYSVNISLDFLGQVEEWDTLTGEINEIDAVQKSDGISFDADFNPVESKLFIIRKNFKVKKQPSSVVNKRHESILGFLGPSCEFYRAMPNALVLDKCAYRMNKGEWSSQTDTWQAQREIRESLKMRQVFYNGLPQRYKWIGEQHINDGVPVELKYNFYVKDIPKRDVFLVVEDLKYFKISLNGKAIPTKRVGWYLDKSFNKIVLPELQNGANEIILSCDYINEMELEDCYLIGDFGVDTGRNIVAEQNTIHFGDWCMQGYLHYCGSIVYKFKFVIKKQQNEKVFIRLGEYCAVNVEVRVNGKTAGNIPWRAAGEVEITDCIMYGENDMEIEVMGSPRNIFGPFHQGDNKQMWTDWRSFRKEGAECIPDYVVKPYGLFGQITVYSLIYD